LRISPIILTALEEGDFAHMPLKGHARNMISSYARYLGLDAEEITAQFLSEYHAFENHASRRSVLPVGSMSADSIGANPAGANSAYPDRYANSSQRSSSASGDQGMRSMWNKPIPKSELNRGYDSRSSSAQRVANAASRRRSVSRESVTEPTAVNLHNNGTYSRRPGLSARMSKSLFKSPAALIIILVIVLVLLLALWAMAANSCKKKENEVIPISTGAPVEENTATDPDAPLILDEEEQTDPNIGPFELVIEPAAGTGPWTEVTVDGETVFADTLTEKKTWTVTDKCSLTTGQPGNLTVTRNGENVNLEIDSGNGTGSLQLEINKAPTGEQAAS
jgi:cytoskeletal protein RodZ